MQGQVDVRKGGDLGADVTAGAHLRSQQGQAPMGVLAMGGPIPGCLFGPRQFKTVGVPVVEPPDHRPVRHQKACANTGRPKGGLRMERLGLNPMNGRHSQKECSQNHPVLQLNCTSCHQPKGAA